jgi:hypothetical protein
MPGAPPVMKRVTPHWVIGALALLVTVAPRCGVDAGGLSDRDRVQTFLEKHCFECHESVAKKGGLDLTELEFDLADPQLFARWLAVHDRVSAGEMPPRTKPRPEPAEQEPFARSLAASLMAAEGARIAGLGRATQRRLNRYEYENVLRDLLDAPWLQVKDALPEDGEAYRFNKSGGALDVSHHGQSEAKLAQLWAIDEWHMKLLANLMSVLKAVREDGETLLDRTMVFYGSNLGNANTLVTRNLPIVFAGGGFKHGQHLAFDTERNYPLPNLFVSMLQRFGLDVDHFASSTGTMRGLELG